MNYWAPSGTVVSVQPAASASFVVASNQIDGVARIFNIGGTNTAIVAIVSASATVDDAQYVPISPDGDGTLYIAFSGRNPKVLVSNSTCFINPGYMLK